MLAAAELSFAGRIPLKKNVLAGGSLPTCSLYEDLLHQFKTVKKNALVVWILKQDFYREKKLF